MDTKWWQKPTRPLTRWAKHDANSRKRMSIFNVIKCYSNNIAFQIRVKKVYVFERKKKNTFCLLYYFVWSPDQPVLFCFLKSNNGIQCTCCVLYNKWKLLKRYAILQFQFEIIGGDLPRWKIFIRYSKKICD